MVGEGQDEVHDGELRQRSLAAHARQLSERPSSSVKLNVLHVLKEVGLWFMVRERGHGGETWVTRVSFDELRENGDEL